MYKRSAKNIKKKTIVTVVFLILLTLIDLRLRPIIKTIAANRAQIVSTNAINESVLQELSREDIDYSDLVKLERSNEGQILAVSTNIKKINLLKAQMSVAIQDRLSNITIKQAGIPLGTLSGIEIFNGRGPIVPMKISISGSVFTEFTSNFSEAGINQTRHQIYLNVHTRISALVPGYPTNTDVYTNISVSETIIVGKVPRVYASSVNKEDISGIGNLAQADK